MKQRLSFFSTLLLIWLLLAVFVRPASAHANLMQSIPEANATLDRAPVQIELFFSEPLEDGFSTIEVIDLTGKRVDNDDAAVDPTDPLHMTVSLRSLPDGIYTVTWRALSAVDSHITAGAFPIGVGDVDAAALAAAAQASQQVRLSPGEIIARWVTFAAVMVLAGGALFVLTIWEPALTISGIKAAQPPWRRLMLIALLALLIVTAIWLLVQSGQAAGVEIAAPWQDSVRQVLFTTRFGAQWIARVLLSLVILFLVSLPESRRIRWATFAAGLLLLVTISAGSHAAAEPEPLLPIIADTIHLTAASVWVGGLAFFLTALYAISSLEQGERTRLTAALIPRFSALGLISVTTLVLTGVYASLLHIDNLEALTGTIYGQTLIVKIALFLPMFLLGAVNLLVTSPNMKQAASEGGRAGLVGRFRRLVTSEITLAAAVLLSVGLLTTLPPASAAGETTAVAESQSVDDLEMTLKVTPGRVGLNTFTVNLTVDGRPASDVREVAIQFTPATSDLPPTEAQLSAQGEGEYSIEGGFISLPDAWQLQVAVRRENTFDAFANFDVGIGTTAVAQSFPWYRVIGVLTVIAGAVYLFALIPFIPSRRQALAFGRAPGVALALVGLVVFFQPPTQESVYPVNPIPPNAESLATGEQLYFENCLPCHGATGAGDGPVGRTLNPPPADLTQHTIPGVHPDGRLYNWISNGFQDSVMPAFKARLTDEERWNIVNYIRTLATE